MSTSKNKPPPRIAAKRAKSSAKATAGRPRRRKLEADYHHGDLRRALLDAGTAMLEAGGLAALSLREVARKAGVSHNAPYRHFADREALLAGIATAGFDALGAAMAEAKGDRLAVGVAYVQFALARPRLFDLMFGPTLNPADHPDLGPAMTRSFAIFAGQFGVASPPVVPGGAPSDGPRAQLIAPWALAHGLAHLLIGKRMAKSLTGGADVETLIRAVLNASARAAMP